MERQEGSDNGDITVMETRTASDTSGEQGGPIVYKRYKRRFYYALVVIALNLSNAMTWITYAPIQFHTDDFYATKGAATYFNVVFMIVSIPVGFVAIWGTDRFGLRGGCILGAGLNLIGNLLRFVGSGSFMTKDARFPIAFTGQIIAAISQPFIMYLPTKLTGFWFPEDQRNLANTLTSMSNPLGIALMYVLSPQIVNRDHPENFLVLTGITAATAVLSMVMSLLVLSSVPPTPASGSKASALVTPSFKEGFIKSLKSKQFLILTLSLGGGVGLFNALYNNLQPALCMKGYSETFNGLMGGLLIISGLFGAAVAGVIADNKKEWTEYVMKIAFCTAAVGASSLTVAINYPGMEWWIILSIVIFGFFAFAVYPLGLETGVEITFPVAEATSTGIIIISGQLQGVVYVAITGLANQKPNPHDLAIQTCAGHTSEIKQAQDWKYSFIVWDVCLVILILISVIFFKPKLRRMQHDLTLANNQNNIENARILEDNKSPL